MTKTILNKIIPILMCFSLCSCQTSKYENKESLEDLEHLLEEYNIQITFVDPIYNLITFDFYKKNSEITHTYKVPEIEGYTCHFVGWSLTKDGEILEKLPNATSNATYYAKVTTTINNKVENYEYETITSPDINNLDLSIHDDEINETNYTNYFTSEESEISYQGSNISMIGHKSILIGEQKIVKIGICKSESAQQLTSEQESKLKENIRKYKNAITNPILNLKSTDNILPRRPNSYINTFRYITDSQIINELVELLDLKNQIFFCEYYSISDDIVYKSSHSISNESNNLPKVSPFNDQYCLEVEFESGIIQTYYISNNYIALYCTPILHYESPYVNIKTYNIARYL